MLKKTWSRYIFCYFNPVMMFAFGAIVNNSERRKLSQ